MSVSHLENGEVGNGGGEVWKVGQIGNVGEVGKDGEVGEDVEIGEDGEVGKGGADTGQANLVVLTARVCENYSVGICLFLNFLYTFLLKSRA